MEVKRCRYFDRTGACKYDEHCNFLHIPKDIYPMGQKDGFRANGNRRPSSQRLSDVKLDSIGNQSEGRDKEKDAMEIDASVNNMDYDMDSSSSSSDDEEDEVAPRSAPAGRRNNRGGRIDTGGGGGGGWGGSKGNKIEYTPSPSRGGGRRRRGKEEDQGRESGRGGGAKVSTRLLRCDHTPRYMEIPGFMKKREGQRKLTIVCLSDTHGAHHIIQPLPQGKDHILIHCGDFTHMGSIEDTRRFNDWLGTVQYDYKFVISGNHERLCGPIRDHDKFRDLLTNGYFVTHEFVRLEEYGGLTMFLSSWDKKVKPYADESEERELFPWNDPHLYRKEEGKEGGDDRGIDILVTHQPAYGLVDRTHTMKHRGSKEYLRLVKNIKPILYLFGHVHRGGEDIAKDPKKTSYINAANPGDKGAIVVEYYYDP